MSKRYAAPGARAKTWNRVATVGLGLGALVTGYMVYLAFASVS